MGGQGRSQGGACGTVDHDDVDIGMALQGTLLSSPNSLTLSLYIYNYRFTTAPFPQSVISLTPSKILWWRLLKTIYELFIITKSEVVFILSFPFRMGFDSCRSIILTWLRIVHCLCLFPHYLAIVHLSSTSSTRGRSPSRISADLVGVFQES